MCRERIITEYLKDLKAGIVRDYSLPEATVFLTPDHTWSAGREGETASEGCAITRQQ